MQNITFPVQFRFKISTLSNDFTATDANGQTLAYVRQKLLKLKEDIFIYSDESKTTLNYRIKADKWLDFSAAYAFYNQQDQEFGKIVRKGWKSLWKAEYVIIDQFEQEQYRVNEENPWVKVLDSVFAEIPLLGIFTGYLFNPSYLLKDKNDQPVIRIKKKPSFLGREFELTQLGTMDSDDDDRILLGVMMMMLLEKRRG